MSNIKVKDYLNEQRFILATGSGTDADPYIVHHISRLQDGTGSPIASGVSAPGSTERGLVVRNIPSGSQIINLSEYNGAAVGASNSLHIRPGVNETFPISGAVTISAVVDVKQGTASALNLTATQGPAGSVTAAWPFKLVTSSGDPVVSTATSSVRVAGIGVFDIIQATASALNATVTGALEVRQSNASALQVTAEVRQATASALQATVTQVASPSGWTARLVTPSGDTAMDTGLSAARVYVVGGSTAGFEARQANASALRATAEIYQATASALQVTAAQAANASGWTTRMVTPSGDTAMDTANSALRVNLVAGGAGNGNIQDGVQSNLPATVKGYASGSPLLVALAQADGAHLASLDVKQATASALNATVTGNVGVTGVVDVKQTTASALNATVHGFVEVRQSLGSALHAKAEVAQSNASALRATAEIYQATASALQVTATQSPTASGWTTRMVTPSGDTAMDTTNSALRVNLVAGGAGNGNIQDGVQSNLPATVKGYASGSPLLVALAQADGAHLASLDIKQATASALQMTVNGFVEVRQSLGSALHVKAEVAQSLASALRATAEIYQAAPSALRATAEIYQGTASALNAFVQGEIAHDAGDSGNPLKIGGKGLEASPTNVTHADRVNAYFDKAGRQFVRGGHQAQDQWTATCAPGNTNIRATATQANSTSGTRLVCTGLTVTLVGGSAAPAASYMNVQLVSGTSLWVVTLAIPATAGAAAGITRTNLWYKGHQASGMSLEFLSAGGANVAQSVSFEGTTLVE
jgi:hypothetical protein